jgi:hypothetical protein
MSAAWFPVRCIRDFPRDPRRGFALLLVIVVLGFLVLVVVALATHLRLEQTVALRRSQIEQARRHALTGLALAIGQLQQAAGPDRRATAGAPLLGPVAANKTHWVGVWVPGVSTPQWMVSSADPGGADPASATLTDPVVMVGPASADVSAAATVDPDQVRVDTLLLRVSSAFVPGWKGGRDPVIGRTAYWVGEEGGKLPAVVRDERSLVTGEAPPDPWPQMDASALWGGYDLQGASAQGALAKVLAYGQLGYVDATAFSPARLRRNIHRATVVALGVLSNPADGGLKQPGQVDGLQAYGSPEAPRYDQHVYVRNPPAGTDPDHLPAARFAVYRPGGVTPLASELSGSRASAKLLITGGFNLNAISDDAAIQRERWRAVLAAARTVRFPGGSARTLTATELDVLASQLTALRFRAAYADVGKAAFAPFASVGQWARSGLLQAAIDAAAINQGRPAEAVDRVDQQDLLALLAPILGVRSDTFLVRAYGQVRDPFRDEGLGEAWCEAVVQRVPDHVDPADVPWEAATRPDNLLLGRKFVVTSFRWLTTADL